MSAPTGTGVSTPSIAVVVNTRNEAGNLPAMLASCTGADQVVVADMESTDDTVALARAAGAAVLALPNAGICEPGRQPAIDAAGADWVLVLDADERLSAGGLDELRELAARADPAVAAYLIPEITLMGGRTVNGTGWGTRYERHPRFFRQGTITWPATIHAVPTFSGRCVDLPEGSTVHLTHESFRDLDHAWQKFNTYSGVEGIERAAAGAPTTWLTGLDDAIGEFTRRYQPDVDGGVSFALACGIFFYRLGVHLKALDARDELAPAPVPSAPAMAEALRALRDTLRSHEVRAARHRADQLAEAGDLVGAASLIETTAAVWQPDPDLLTDTAVLAARSGATAYALMLVDQVLQQCPDHAEARTARLALQVATGVRPPVTHLLIGSAPAEAGEVVVVPPGTPGGDLQAPLDALPFAPGSLRRIRVAASCLDAAQSTRKAVEDALRPLLVPEGSVQWLDEPAAAPCGDRPGERPTLNPGPPLADR